MKSFTCLLLPSVYFNVNSTSDTVCFLKYVFCLLWPVGCAGCTDFGCFWQTNLVRHLGSNFFSGPRYLVNPYCLLSDKLKTNIQFHFDHRHQSHKKEIRRTIFSCITFLTQLNSKLAEYVFFYSLKQWLVIILHLLVHMSQIRFCFNAFKARWNFNRLFKDSSSFFLWF